MAVAKLEAHESGMIVILDQVEMPLPFSYFWSTSSHLSYILYVLPPLPLPVLPMAIPFVRIGERERNRGD